ncbi:MAG: phosphoribosylformylglycinamidine synthase subunit PurL [Bacteroidota bacterium]
MKNRPIIKEEPVVDLNLAKQHGLTEEEYEQILKILKRVPTYTELGIYSVMWSEHCSYKNSIALLKTLPRSGKGLLVAAGEENAGLIDIGEGLAVAFKIESHNHPSAIEPYQGAATGVGGILRDIFSMGARPIAALNSLRFGNLDDKRVQYLFKRIVKGIGDYGNSFGVPTVAGEIYFDPCYRTNPLVNAMAVGIVEHNGIAKASATGKDNSVMIVGSATGRDGIHGATFASEEISEKSESKRPAVQVGDPFVEKLLLEATLEAIKTGYIVGVQDMGAAGITCSTTEMSARGKTGMDVDLAKVPLRETGMTAYEVMLSESQERMLFVVKKGHEEEIANIFKKWDIEAEVVGKVTDGPLVKIRIGNIVMAEVNAETLVLGGSAPIYHRKKKEPEYLADIQKFQIESVPEEKDYSKSLQKLLGRTSIASKRWVYQQYDSMVRTNTITSTADAAVIRIKGTKKAIALKTDGNGRYVYLNPRRGAEIAVAESARNVVCVGARPIAITNCLNFGNPYDPEVYWQFFEAIGGMCDACNAFETPVTGGNVSFYNESTEEAIYPTPVIGMLGVIDDVKNICDHRFKSVGDIIWELGVNYGELGGSEYLQMQTNKVYGNAPKLDLCKEKTLYNVVLRLIQENLVKSAHDVSDGGIAVTMAESLFETGLGAKIELINKDLRIDSLLFGESQSRIIISSSREAKTKILEITEKQKLKAAIIGEVIIEEKLIINDWIEESVETLKGIYENAIESCLK